MINERLFRRHLLIFLLIELYLPHLYAQTAQSVLEGNICQFETVVSHKKKIQVQIEMGEKHNLTSEDVEKLDLDRSWRRDRYSSHPQVQRVQIKVNGEPVLIPQSACMDLINVARIEVWERKGTIRIRLSGADAGESYSATFKLIASHRMVGEYRVAERILRAGEFPDEVVERTIYKNSIWDDPNM